MSTSEQARFRFTQIPPCVHSLARPLLAEVDSSDLGYRDALGAHGHTVACQSQPTTSSGLPGGQFAEMFGQGDLEAMSSHEADPVQSALAPVYGKPSWDVHQGYGSFLTFEFGEPSLNISGPFDRGYFISPKIRGRTPRRLAYTSGEWHLSTYLCHWTIRRNGKQLAHSESPRHRIERAANILNGQALTKVMPKDAGRWVFEFDLGGLLLTCPYEAPDDDEQWWLFEPTGFVLTVRADGRYSHDPDTTPSDQHEWLPLAGRSSTDE